MSLPVEERSRPGAAGAGLFVMVLLLSSASCTTTGNSPPGVSPRVIEGIPFYPQQAYQCGPAALAAVLNFHDVAVTPDDIAADIFSRGAKGTLAMDMVLYARTKGLRADQYSGGLDDLKRTIDAGNPVIILVDYGFWVYQKVHFMVLLGYHEKGFVADSGREHLKVISRDELIRIWEKTRFWTLVVRK